MLKYILLIAALFISGCDTSTPTTLTGQSKLRKATKPIKDQYIVVLKPSVDTEKKSKEHLGKNPDKLYRKVLRGYASKMSEEKALEISKDPDVMYVEEDAETFPAQTPWGLDRIDQRILPLDGTYTSSGVNASNVHAYVVDSGIRPTHSEFGGRATVDYDAVGDGQNGIDCSGHGTHVAGTIGSSTYGVSKTVRIHSVRVLPCTGTGQVSHMIMGLDWIAANRVLPAVANISITASGPSNAMDTAIQNTINTGVTVVVAAGNYNMNACEYSPARMPAAITVGATTSSDIKASYSNYGSCVDIWAPGSSILSLSHLDDVSTRTMSGTSMAAPHVTGAIASYLASSPTSDPAIVTQSVLQSATSNIISGVDINNLFLYSFIETAFPSPTPTMTPTPTPTPVPTPECIRYTTSGRCIKYAKRT
jgi:subtilisin family serine protease